MFLISIGTGPEIQTNRVLPSQVFPWCLQMQRLRDPGLPETQRAHHLGGQASTRQSHHSLMSPLVLVEMREEINGEQGNE